MKMSQFYQKLEKGLYRSSQALNWVSIITIALMTLVVTVDVFANYLFSKPFTGSNDIVELMMVVTVFCSLAYCAFTDGNVQVDIIYGRLSKRVKACLDIVSFAGATFIFTLITWRLGLRAWNIVQNPLSGPTTGTLGIPHLSFIWLATFCSCLLCLVLLIKFINSIIRLKAV
jgi:TRAP-type C4-dicarboxylate transport system permease small subunit